MVAIKHAQLRRLYEAAERDRNPSRFFEDIGRALEKRELRPQDFSVRQLFEQFVPDGRELVESWNPRQGGGVTLQEAGDAVQTAAFANISGQIVYSAILEKYMAEELVFSKLIPNQPTQFNGEKIAGIGQMGDGAEIVGEAQPYPTVGVTEDWIETPQTTKRGMIVPITKEAIFFDRTGVLLDRCREVGEWLGVNKEKRAIDCVVDENVTTHRYKWRGTSYATYQTTTPWDNVTASNALVDWTDIDAAEQTMAALIDPNTGEPIMVVPKHLIVNRELLYTARRIVEATTLKVATPGWATTGNPSEAEWKNPVTGYSVLTSVLLASRMATDTSWFIGDVTKAFRYMENWPLAVVSAPANSDDDFKRDIVQQFKASERGQYATVEPRAMNKSTVA
jgi:hypothetical protein